MKKGDTLDFLTTQSTPLQRIWPKPQEPISPWISNYCASMILLVIAKVPQILLVISKAYKCASSFEIIKQRAVKGWDERKLLWNLSEVINIIKTKILEN